MSAFPPLAELLPQRGPALALDEVLAADGPRVACGVTVRADSAHARDGRVPATAALEYMAQAIGAWVGLRARARGEPIRLGFLLGTRELRLDVECFEPGDVLRVEVEHLWGDVALGTFRCHVRRGEAVVAEATVNVFQGDPEEVARR